MVIQRHGDDPNLTLGCFIAEGVVRVDSGRTYLVDAESGALIAALTAQTPAAALIGERRTITTFDGSTITVGN